MTCYIWWDKNTVYRFIVSNNLCEKTVELLHKVQKNCQPRILYVQIIYFKNFF